MGLVTLLFSFNPFTAMTALEKRPIKVRNYLKPLSLFDFSHWHVKGFSFKRVAPKADVLWDRNIHCF